MTAILERRISPAAKWSQRLASFAAVLFITSALSHRFGVLETIPFLWIIGLTGVSAFFALCLAAIGLVQIWEHGVGGLQAASLGAFLSLLVLAPYAASAVRIAIYPRLTDISTDISRPPRLVLAESHRGAGMNPLRPVPQEAALLQAEAYPELAGRRYEHTRESVVEAVGALLAERGWELRTPLPPQDANGSATVEAVARSYLLGFPADVAIRIEDRFNATFVDMRSASRYGRHDMGDNALRIERFLDDLDRRMQVAGDI